MMVDYYLVTGWYKSDDGSMTHTQTWSCDNEPSFEAVRSDLLATVVTPPDEGEGTFRRAYAVRFERVTENGDDRGFDLVDELWFPRPLPGWHDLV